MSDVTINNFELVKIKYLNGELSFTAEVREETEDEVNKITLKDTYRAEPHKDLLEPLENLKAWLASAHNLLMVHSIINREDFQATAAQRSFAEGAKTKILEKVEVTGVSLSGKDDMKGATITGKNDGMSINTRPIKFKGTHYGFESELESVCEVLEDELFQYLYRGKRAKSDQLDIFKDGKTKTVTKEYKGKVIKADDFTQEIETLQGKSA